MADIRCPWYVLSVRHGTLAFRCLIGSKGYVGERADRGKCGRRERGPCEAAVVILLLLLRLVLLLLLLWWW